MSERYRAIKYRTRIMEDAPTDGSLIVAYVRTTNRPVTVKWNGRHWDEGNGEKWDAGQLAGWHD